MQLRNPSVNLKGIDISHNNGGIDWKAVASDGVKFAYVKLTEGLTFLDPKADENLKGAQKNGIKSGFYHFARFTDIASAKKEAQWFVDHAKGYKVDLPHVLDIEVNLGKLNKSDMSKCIEAWFEIVKPHGDIMIYTGDSFEHDFLDESLKNVPLWVAHYGSSKPNESPIWQKWSVFQYSQSGKVSGIHGNVDMDEAVDGFFHATTKPHESIVKKVAKVVEHIIHHDTHYSVSPGDSLSKIAAKFNVSVGDLVKWNNIKDENLIKVGSMLIVKKANQHVTPSHTSKKTYIVKSGDSFSKIASDNKMSLVELEKLNPQINDPTLISIGEKINLN